MRASSGLCPSWAVMTSRICSPTVSTGLSAFMALCITRLISFQRKARS